MSFWNLPISILALCFFACLDDPKTPPESATDNPAVESGRTSTARIGSLGGELHCESVRGVKYVLEIPPGSLPETTSISISPLKDFGTRPLAGGFLGGVRCEPAGLKFLVPLTLRIEGASDLPDGKRLVGFSADDSGGAFRVGLARTDSQGILLRVSHFSLHGAAAATVAELGELPELAPLATPYEVAEEDLVIQGLSEGVTVKQIADILREYFVEAVKPALEKEANSDDLNQHDGVSEYFSFIELLVMAAGFIDQVQLEEALAKELDEGDKLAAGLIKRQIDESNKRCVEKADLSEFRMATFWHWSAQEMGMDTEALGLDRQTFWRDACVRPVLDPLKLPSPMTVGKDLSLDARAQLVIQGSPNPVSNPFAFTLTAQGATLGTPKGFSDAEGRFTSVITATGEGTVSVEVEACALLFGTQDLCIKEVVSERGSHRVETEILVRQHKYAEAPASFSDTCTAQPLQDTSSIPVILENGCLETKMAMTWRVIEDGVELRIDAASIRRRDAAQTFPQFLLGEMEVKGVVYFLPDQGRPMEFQVELDSRPIATPEGEEVSAEWNAIITDLGTNRNLIDVNKRGPLIEGKDSAGVTLLPTSTPDTVKLGFEFECGVGCGGEGATFRVSQKKAVP